MNNIIEARIPQNQKISRVISGTWVIKNPEQESIEISAFGDSIVHVWGNVLVKAFDESLIRCHNYYNKNNPVVYAYGNSHIYANEDSIVKAYGNSIVQSFHDSMVFVYDNSTIFAHGNSIIRGKLKNVYKIKPVDTIKKWLNMFKIKSKDNIVILYQSVDWSYKSNFGNQYFSHVVLSKMGSYKLSKIMAHSIYIKHLIDPYITNKNPTHIIAKHSLPLYEVDIKGNKI